MCNAQLVYENLALCILAESLLDVQGLAPRLKALTCVTGKGVAAGSRLAFGRTTVWIDVCLVIESREICDGIIWWSLRLWMGEGAEFP
jgi:hypothetical protein